MNAAATIDRGAGAGRDRRERRERRAATWRELDASARLAAPVVAVQLGWMSMSVVDTAMLGHLSTGALAASAIAHIVSITVLAFGSATLSALDPLISQAFGAGDRAAVTINLRKGLVLAVALAALPTLVMADLGPLLRALGEPAGVSEDAAAYLRLLLLGNLPFLLFFALRQTLQAMSLVRQAFSAVLVASLVNAGANYALIFGHWGLPRLGVIGSAGATAAARWVMFFWILAAARRPLAARAPGWWSWRALAAVAAAPRGLLTMLRIGLPSGLHQTLELSFFMTIALLMGRFDAVSLAGHEIAIMLASLSFMVPLGISGAAATRVGHAIGRADMAAARRTAAVNLGLGAGAMLLFAAAFGFAPRLLASLFTADPAVIAVTAALLPIAAVFQVFDGLQVVSTGVLRGTADTALPAAGALFGYWVLGMPAGCALAFAGGLGPRGLWWGATLGLGLVALLLVSRIASRFRHDIRRVEA